MWLEDDGILLPSWTDAIRETVTTLKPKSSTFNQAARSQNPIPVHIPEEYDSSQGMGAVGSFLTEALQFPMGSRISQAYSSA